MAVKGDFVKGGPLGPSSSTPVGEEMGTLPRSGEQKTDPMFRGPGKGRDHSGGS